MMFHRKQIAKEKQIREFGIEDFENFSCPIVSWNGRNWYRVLNTLVPCSQHGTINLSDSEKGALNTLWVMGANIIEIGEVNRR